MSNIPALMRTDPRATASSPNRFSLRLVLPVLLVSLTIFALGACLMEVLLAHDSGPSGVAPSHYWLLVWLAAAVLSIAGNWFLVRQVLRRSVRDLEAERDRRNRLIVDAAADGIITVDDSGKIETVNPAAEFMFGYSEGELTGRNISLLISVKDSRSFDMILRKSIQTGEAHVLGRGQELEGRRKNGSSIPIELAVSKVLDAQRRTFIQIVRDLSERKLTESRQRVQYDVTRILAEMDTLEAALPCVLEVICGGLGWPLGLFWLVEDPRDPKPRVTAVWRSPGLPAEALVTARQASVCSLEKDHIGRAWVRQETLWAANVLHSLDEPCGTLAHQTGLRSCLAVPVILHGAALGCFEFLSQGLEAPDDALLGLLGSLAGQTAQFHERKKAERELKRSRDQAEAANRDKSRFLANVSHEMRTPLGGIIGLTGMLFETSLQSDQREYLGLIRTSSNNLLGLINDLLDLSKIEAARLDLEQILFNLRETLDSPLRMLETRAREKSLTLHFHLAPETPVELIGDPLRLQQVLINLVGNAIKFTPRGEIVVTVRPEKDHSVRDPQFAVLFFEVRDTGIGIPLEKQESIFEAFTQADNSASRLYGGTGLGLTIASRLIGLMGGRIGVESEVGKGSTFFFTARFALPNEGSSKPHTHQPRLVEEPEPPPAAAPADAAATPLRILLAEDSEINRLVALHLLRNQNCKVRAVCDGQEALDAHAEEEFDLIFMDVQMPKLDGFEATQQIRRREQETAKHVRIVAMTAHAMEGDRERCLAAGMDDYVSKPLKTDEIYRAVAAGRLTAGD
jgi:PAS domain S-box-containing protein